MYKLGIYFSSNFPWLSFYADNPLPEVNRPVKGLTCSPVGSDRWACGDMHHSLWIIQNNKSMEHALWGFGAICDNLSRPWMSLLYPLYANTCTRREWEKKKPYEYWWCNRVFKPQIHFIHSSKRTVLCKHIERIVSPKYKLTRPKRNRKYFTANNNYMDSQCASENSSSIVEVILWIHHRGLGLVIFQNTCDLEIIFIIICPV